MKFKYVSRLKARQLSPTRKKIQRFLTTKPCSFKSYTFNTMSTNDTNTQGCGTQPNALNFSFNPFNGSSSAIQGS